METHMTMEGLTRLGAPVPPMLEEAIGYEGTARLVAFYWEPGGDEAAYHDGRRGLVGANWHAYLTYTRHAAVAPHLAGYAPGNADEPARHWLVLDRAARVLYVGLVTDARRALSAQWPPLPDLPPLTAEEWADLARRATEQARHAAVDHRSIVAAMERAVHLCRDLAAWLDRQ